MKTMMLVVSVVASFGMVGCALEEPQPADSEQSSDVQIQPRQTAANCWGGIAGIHSGACGGVIADVPSGSRVNVLGTPFTSGCDGNLWVAATFGSAVGDIRWDALCNFQ